MFFVNKNSLFFAQTFSILSICSGHNKGKIKIIFAQTQFLSQLPGGSAELLTQVFANAVAGRIKWKLLQFLASWFASLLSMPLWPPESVKFTFPSLSFRINIFSSAVPELIEPRGVFLMPETLTYKSGRTQLLISWLFKQDFANSSFLSERVAAGTQAAINLEAEISTLSLVRLEWKHSRLFFLILLNSPCSFFHSPQIPFDTLSSSTFAFFLK